MKISIFNRADHVDPIGVITIEEFLDRIKGGYWRAEVDKIRLIEDKEKRQKLKLSTLQCVTVSGAFAKRNQASLLCHSEFMSIDFDDVDGEFIEPLKQDKYTYALAMSASGNGYFAIVKVNPEKHSESFDWLRVYYFKEYGLILDEKPRNVASLRYASYDPDLFINEKSTKARFIVKKPKPIKTTTHLITGSDFEHYVNEVVKKGVDISNDDYDDYYRIGFGIASEYKEAGRQYFHDICSQYHKYNFKECNKQYDYCLRGNREGVTIASVYYYMRKAGIELKSSISNEVIAFTRTQIKTGESIDSLKKSLKEIHKLDKEKIDLVVNKIDEIKTKNLEDLDHSSMVDYLESYVMNKWQPRYNVIRKFYEANNQELTDEVFNMIALDSQKELNTPKVTDTLLWKTLINPNIERYDMVKDFREKFQHIEFEGTLERFVQGIEVMPGGLSQEDARIFIKRWLIQLAASLDGKVVRLVLAFVGGQFTGKSEFFRRLLPESLSCLHDECAFTEGKDDRIKMCKFLILVDDEQINKGERDEKQFKKYASTHKFNIRLPYARSAVDMTRLAVLAITSNETEIMNDPTGNTRFLPIHIKRFNHELLDSIDRNALFMDILYLYETKQEGYQLSERESEVLKNINDDFSHVNYEEELLLKYFEKPYENEKCYRMASEVRATLKSILGNERFNSKKLSFALKKHFGDRVPYRMNGTVQKGYLVKESRAVYDAQNKTYMGEFR